MRITYAVTWQESDGPSTSGRLELAAGAVRLDGGNGSGPISVEIPYGELRGYRTATPGERLDDRPTIVVELPAGRTLRIASVAQPGIVGELADRLSERYAV
jgi:hypothetical protein